MKHYSLDKDANGNKVLRLSVLGYGTENRGFSVQTNGNLPKTHAMTKDDFNHLVASGEMINYIMIYGTERQKRLVF